ncbi:MAG: signal peptide peptidase SppA [Planctomycetes bacterium]|nr:signal peptide peptidase SppA [Planctomycetota bacterium]
METIGYTAEPPGLHVRPAPPPKKPSTAWKVVKWLLVAGLVAVCGVSGFFNMIFLTGLSSSVASHGKIIEEHVSGASGFSVSSKVAIVSAHDVLLGSEDSGSAAWIIRQLAHAREDSKVKAIILDVDTPGGGITACDIIHRKITDLQKGGTKVIVLMRNIAASGGYYISAPADLIIAHPTSITGSIGVIVSSYNVESLFEKIGVRSVVFKSGPHKDILSPYRAISDEEREILQTVVDEMFTRFKDVVQKGRNLTDEELEAATDGSIITADKAMDLGLIDQIGYFTDAEKAARKAAGASGVEVVRYNKPPTLSDVLFSSSQSAASDFQERLDRLTKTLQPGFYYLWPGP